MIAFLLGGLFLSFSRGAWMHFAFLLRSALLILVLIARIRACAARIVVFAVGAPVAMALLVVAMSSIAPVHDLFIERAGDPAL